MPQQAKTDRTLFATTVGLAFFGLVMVYSASSVMAMQDPRYHSSAYFVIRQAIFLVPGMALMMFMKRISYPKLQTPAVAFATIGCSIMLYVKTAREWWSGARTAFRFFATAAVLGLATTLVSLLAFGCGPGGRVCAGVSLAARLLAIATGVKLAWETSILLHLRDKQWGSLRRTASLLLGELRREAGARLALGLAGGVLAPLLVVYLANIGDDSKAALVFAIIGWAALVGAELLERALFFRAASPPRMPGGV